MKTLHANTMRLLLARIDQIITSSEANPSEIRQHIQQAFFAAGYDAPSSGTFTMHVTFNNNDTRTFHGWPHRAMINAAINAVHDRRITRITFVRHVDQQREAEEG